MRNRNAKAIPAACETRRYLRLIAACVIMMAIGFIYGWSVFSAPLAEEFGWEPTVMSFTFTVLMWAFCAGGIIGANVTRRSSPQTTIALSALGILVSFTLTAMFITRDIPWLMYGTYGLIGGCSVGMAYTTTMGAVVAWFPDRTGLASGVMLLCYGLSTMLLSSVAAWFFELLGWRWSYIAIAAGIAIVVIACSLVVRPPTNKEKEALGTERAQQKTGNRNALYEKPFEKKEPEVIEYTTSEMLRQPAFYAYACWMLAVSCIGLGLIGAANQLALDAGAAVPVAVGIVGALSLCNGCGRLAVGLLFDRVGPTITMVIVACAHAAGCILVLAALVESSVICMAVGVVIGGLGIGGTSVVGSGFTAKTFGSAHYAENLAILNLTLIPAALIGPLILSASSTWANTYSFGVAGLAALGVLALCCAGITKSCLKATVRADRKA